LAILKNGSSGRPGIFEGEKPNHVCFVRCELGLGLIEHLLDSGHDQGAGSQGGQDVAVLEPLSPFFQVSKGRLDLGLLLDDHLEVLIISEGAVDLCDFRR